MVQPLAGERKTIRIMPLSRISRAELGDLYGTCCLDCIEVDRRRQVWVYRIAPGELSLRLRHWRKIYMRGGD